MLLTCTAPCYVFPTRWDSFKGCRDAVDPNLVNFLVRNDLAACQGYLST